MSRLTANLSNISKTGMVSTFGPDDLDALNQLKQKARAVALRLQRLIARLNSTKKAIEDQRQLQREIEELKKSDRRYTKRIKEVATIVGATQRAWVAAKIKDGELLSRDELYRLVTSLRDELKKNQSNAKKTKLDERFAKHWADEIQKSVLLAHANKNFDGWGEGWGEPITELSNRSYLLEQYDFLLTFVEELELGRQNGFSTLAEEFIAKIKRQCQLVRKLLDLQITMPDGSKQKVLGLYLDSLGIDEVELDVKSLREHLLHASSLEQVVNVIREQASRCQYFLASNAREQEEKKNKLTELRETNDYSQLVGCVEELEDEIYDLKDQQSQLQQDIAELDSQHQEWKRLKKQVNEVRLYSAVSSRGRLNLQRNDFAVDPCHYTHLTQSEYPELNELAVEFFLQTVAGSQGLQAFANGQAIKVVHVLHYSVAGQAGDVEVWLENSDNQRVRLALPVESYLQYVERAKQLQFFEGKVDEALRAFSTRVVDHDESVVSSTFKAYLARKKVARNGFAPYLEFFQVVVAQEAKLLQAAITENKRSVTNKRYLGEIDKLIMQGMSCQAWLTTTALKQYYAYRCLREQLMPIVLSAGEFYLDENYASKLVVDVYALVEAQCFTGVRKTEAEYRLPSSGVLDVNCGFKEAKHNAQKVLAVRFEESLQRAVIDARSSNGAAAMRFLASVLDFSIPIASLTISPEAFYACVGDASQLESFWKRLSIAVLAHQFESTAQANKLLRALIEASRSRETRQLPRFAAKFSGFMDFQSYLIEGVAIEQAGAINSLLRSLFSDLSSHVAASALAMLTQASAKKSNFDKPSVRNFFAIVCSRVSADSSTVADVMLYESYFAGVRQMVEVQLKALREGLTSSVNSLAAVTEFVTELTGRTCFIAKFIFGDAPYQFCVNDKIKLELLKDAQIEAFQLAKACLASNKDSLDSLRKFQSAGGLAVRNFLTDEQQKALQDEALDHIAACIKTAVATRRPEKVFTMLQQFGAEAIKVNNVDLYCELLGQGNSDDEDVLPELSAFNFAKMFVQAWLSNSPIPQDFNVVARLTSWCQPTAAEDLGAVYSVKLINSSDISLVANEATVELVTQSALLKEILEVIKVTDGFDAAVAAKLFAMPFTDFLQTNALAAKEQNGFDLASQRKLLEWRFKWLANNDFVDVTQVELKALHSQYQIFLSDVDDNEVLACLAEKNLEAFVELPVDHAFDVNCLEILQRSKATLEVVVDGLGKIADGDDLPEVGVGSPLVLSHADAARLTSVKAGLLDGWSADSEVCVALHVFKPIEAKNYQAELPVCCARAWESVVTANTAHVIFEKPMAQLTAALDAAELDAEVVKGLASQLYQSDLVKESVEKKLELARLLLKAVAKDPQVLIPVVEEAFFADANDKRDVTAICRFLRMNGSAEDRKLASEVSANRLAIKFCNEVDRVLALTKSDDQKAVRFNQKLETLVKGAALHKWRLVQLHASDAVKAKVEEKLTLVAENEEVDAGLLASATAVGAAVMSGLTWELKLADLKGQLQMNQPTAVETVRFILSAKNVTPDMLIDVAKIVKAQANKEAVTEATAKVLEQFYGSLPVLEEYIERTETAQDAVVTQEQEAGVGYGQGEGAGQGQGVGAGEAVTTVTNTTAQLTAALAQPQTPSRMSQRRAGHDARVVVEQTYPSTPVQQAPTEDRLSPGSAVSVVEPTPLGVMSQLGGVHFQGACRRLNFTDTVTESGKGIVHQNDDHEAADFGFTVATRQG